MASRNTCSCIHFDGDASNTGSLAGYTMTVVDSAYGTVIGGLWTGTSCTLP
jgi:hypothetical protein